MNIDLPNPAWSSLRALGNHPALRLTIAIPMIGYYLVFNAEILHYLKLSPDLIPDQPSISWRLMFTYFGLCCLAVASAIYQWKCPTIVKQYASISQYQASVAPFWSDLTNSTVRSELSNSEDPIVQNTVFEIDHRAGFVNSTGIVVDQNEPKKQQLDLLAVNWVSSNASLPMFRRLSFSFYSLAGLLLLIPSLDVFCRVVWLALRSALK